MTTNPDSKNQTSHEAAVKLADRDALVTANAGSGKTHLLVDRYFHLLSQGVHPNSMVAFTFTEKAARQLKEKILHNLPRHPDFSALPKGTLREWRDQIHEAPIGTIHQFCLRVLQECSGEAGPFRGKIIDPATEINLRESILNQILQEAFELRHEATELLLPVYGMPGLRDTLRAFVIKQEAFVEGETVSRDLPELEPDEKILSEALLSLGQKVKAQMDLAKRRHHWLSFDDLELRALENLRHPNPALQKFLSPLLHLLVDEFQDTSPIQIAILEALRHFKEKKGQSLFLFAVGDPKQSIYRFRNVDRSLIEQTEEKILKKGGRAFLLPTNYRSRPSIVDLANRFSATAFPKAAPSQAIRLSEGEAELHVVPIEATEEDANRASRQSAEARWIAEKIKYYHEQGRPWESMAVLFRASASALPLIDPLKELSIPFTLRGGRDLLDRQEILDLKNLLFFLNEPHEDLYLLGLLRSPLLLLSDAALFFLMREVPKEQSLFSVLQQSSDISFPQILEKQLPGEAAKTRWALNLLQSWVKQAALLSPHALLRTVVHQLDVRRLYGEIGGDWEAPLAIEQFLTWLAQLESELDRPDLRSVVSLLKQLGRTPTLKAPLGDLVEGNGCVHLLTIHSAKGLQFPTVFLMDLARSTPPFREMVQYQGGQWALKIPDAEGEYRETKRFQAMKENHLREEAEENKRLLYVALTRAQEELWIPLHAKSRGKNNLEALLRTHVAEDILNKHLHAEPSISSTSVSPAASQNFPAPAPRLQLHRTEELPRLTVSQMESFSQCPLKYYFSYHQGFSDEEWNELNHPSQTVLGTLLHRGLHHQRFFPNKTPEQIIQYLLQTEPLWNQEAMVADLISYLENYLHSDAFKKIARAQEDHSELPFILKLKNGYVRGQLDRLAKWDGQWHLIDFKFSTKILSVEQIQKDYGFQLRTYALAARQFLQGKLPRVEVHLLGNARALPITLGETQLIAHQQALETTLDKFQSIPLDEIQLREFCYSCPFNRKVPLCPVPQGGRFTG